MSDNINLMEYLHEIEDTTDLNGCFFINVESYKVIESTIPFAVPEEILWELSVLRDTFQQFGKGFQHGNLQELMIEGDRGYILFYNVPPHLILLAMGKDDINLAYVKLAMIDVLKNIRDEIRALGDKVLTIPAKGFGKIGIEVEPIKPISASESTISEPIPVEQPISEPEAIKTTIPEMEVKEISISEPETLEAPPSEPVIERATSLVPVETTTTLPASEAEEIPNLSDLINSIKQASDEEKFTILNVAFNRLKEEIVNLTGVKVAEILEQLKDAILERIGTSLALFDISRTSREVNKNHSTLQPNEIEKYKDRIQNWATRIIK
ncbi:MAG: hypothetical protein ACFFAT_16345 [Promethearchaeota archaeon]